MAIKVAINGFGRIGRCTLRAIYEQGLQNEFEVVAINASGDLATNAHLLKYDTTHGRFRTAVETEGENCIIIDGKKIAFYS
ncbi:MAG TPA: glyceraldehyde 3-phosphate dehydrogenase NAD-binding domain-containing protein, partial [Azonexus sp.]|nr:glyceraldehyde 3-phosphate dehydrogenase NAD-binding domain-containing protein [Azonexus sp.]